ncbi:MAG: SURF1 family protein, partial [Gammaproteobacteria bacterium]|nr:SURF1 family protein [Gammaproteobacteria bacterium]
MITPPSHRRSGVRNLLLMFLGLAVFGSLGTWQLNRSAERRAVLDAFESAEASLPVGGLASVPAGGDNTRVRLIGRYLADRQVLLDNMTHEGMRGYHVLTP